MTLPEVPDPEAIFQAARQQILAEHQGLRVGLGEALTLARAAARGEPDARNELPTAICTLLCALKSHMAFEESTLIPIFASNGAGGPDEAAAFRAEHARQRHELETMLTLAREHADPSGLVLPFQTLVADVLTDMSDEERRLAGEAIWAPSPRWALVSP